MADTSAVSLASLFRRPYVVDRISRVGAVSMAMSNFYNMGTNPSGRDGQIVSGTRRSPDPQFVFDIFSNTRLTPKMRGRETGPSVMTPKPVGQVIANAMRFYEMVPFSLNKIANYRKLGSNRFDLLDRMGQVYVTNQMDTQIRRFAHGREFCFVNMLKGGFKVIDVGEDDLMAVPMSYSNVVPKFTVDYRIPASHKSQIALADGGGNIIQTSWADESAPIISDIRKIRAKAVERSGLPITDMWCNTTVMEYIVNNTDAQAAGGSAFRVWDRLTQQEVTKMNPDVGPLGSRYVITMQLRALPEITIHVYDDGLILPKDLASPSYPSDTEDTYDSFSQFVKFMGDDEVLLTPPPSTASQWMDMYSVREIIQRNYTSQPEEVYGMAAWSRVKIEPVPSVEFHTLDNYFPAITVPNAVYNPTVVFGG